MTFQDPGDESSLPSDSICILSIGDDTTFRESIEAVVSANPNLRLIQVESLDAATSIQAFRECSLVILDTRGGPDVAIRYLRQAGQLRFTKPTIFVALEGASTFQTEVEVVNDLRRISDAVTRFKDRNDREHTLAESESMYRDMFEKAGDAFFIHEPGGKFIAVNMEACSSLGYSKEELMNLRAEDIDAPESADKVAERTAKLLRDGEVEFEAFHRKKDGSIYPVEIKLRRFSYMGRSAIIADVRDISDRRLAQEKLRMANEKLTLLGAITRHDVSNRLASIMGYVGLSEQDGVSHSLRSQYMQKVKDSLEAIEEQLKFAGDYQKAGTSDPVWTNPGQTIQAVADTFDFRSVVISPELQELELYVDPMVDRVFWNLMDNAKRHGKGVATMRFWTEARGDGLALIVEDDGCGIPDDEKEHVFGAGYGHHTGMGLFLVKEILAITGISILENGICGKGARFEIIVPAGKHRPSCS